MKRIPLTHGKYALVDDEDFRFVARFSWHLIAGYPQHYVKFNGKGHYVRLHRLVLLAPPNALIDHRDLDKLNCQKENLRYANRYHNAWNKPIHSDNRSGFKGVSVCTGSRLYRVTITCRGKRYHLGYFKKSREAAKVYDEAARKLFGEFAFLNFPHKE